MTLLLVPRSLIESVRPTTLRCSYGDHWLPDEAFGRDGSRVERRGRDGNCRECRRLQRSKPGECIECGGPTRTKNARFCEAHRSEHQSGLARDFYLDRFGDTGHWTPERIVRAIQAWERKYGRTPRQDDWRKRSVGHVGLGSKARRSWPHITTVWHVFGSWNAAIEAAGFKPRRGGRPSNEGTCRKGLHPWVPANIYIAHGIPRCRLCRREYDRKWKRARASYASKNTTTCRKGLHPWVASNIFVGTDGRERCRACRREWYRRKRQPEKEAA